MQRIIVTILLFLFSCIVSHAQDAIHKDAKKYFQHSVDKLSNKFITDKELKDVITNLNKALEIDPKYPDIKYYLGIAYISTEQFSEAFQHLENYKQQCRESRSTFYLYYAVACYRLNNNLAAQENLQYYLSNFSGNPENDSVANRYMQLSKNSQTLMAKLLPSKKESISAINTDEFDEYYPILTPDRKKILFNRLETDSLTGKPKNQIYIYYIDGDTTGPNPRKLPLNNIENKEFVITSIHNSGKKILLISKDSKGLNDIYESEWMVYEFGIPRKMYSQINSYADDKFAAYGHNDSLIYVISNRPGGYGGYDIWKINYNSRYIYESMINLGPGINSEYDENYIATVNNSNLIFFTSEGHLNIGESDIFRTKLEYGQYTRPINLGYPINTTRNESSFYPYPSANMGLSTIKNNSLDIIITFLPPKAKSPAYIMEEQLLGDSQYIKSNIIIPRDE